MKKRPSANGIAAQGLGTRLLPTPWAVCIESMFRCLHVTRFGGKPIEFRSEPLHLGLDRLRRRIDGLALVPRLQTLPRPFNRSPERAAVDDRVVRNAFEDLERPVKNLEREGVRDFGDV